MEIIHPIASIFKDIIGPQKIKEDTKYRFLTFILRKDLKHGTVLYNVLTKELIQLSPEESADIMNVKYLKDWYYLVPEDNDDRLLSNQVRELARNFANPDKGVINHYSILTTTDCNARCFYCFEKGYERKHMIEETAHELAKFIIAHHGKRPVKLSWFGGEPLYNAKVINTICQDLKTAEVEYYSTMISNGYLFTDELIKKAKELWNLNMVQITLDGTHEAYRKIKNYINKDKDALNHVLNNVDKLLEQEIDVTIRLNVSAKNVDDLSKLAEMLIERYSENDHFNIYTFKLFDEFKENPNITLKNEISSESLGKLDKTITDHGYSRLIPLNDKVVLSNCQADSNSSLVVTPEGSFCKCDEIIDKYFVGNIKDGITNEKNYDIYKERGKDLEICQDCAYYPNCGHNKICPSFSCDEYKRNKRIDKLFEGVRTTFNDYKEKENNYETEA